MMSKGVLILMAVIAVVLLGLIAGTLTGMVTFSPEKGVVIGDSISIPKEELKTCCSFTDANNNQKTCNVIAPYTCDYCDQFC